MKSKIIYHTKLSHIYIRQGKLGKVNKEDTYRPNIPRRRKFASNQFTDKNPMEGTFNLLIRILRSSSARKLLYILQVHRSLLCLQLLFVEFLIVFGRIGRNSYLQIL